MNTIRKGLLFFLLLENWAVPVSTHLLPEAIRTRLCAAPSVVVCLCSFSLFFSAIPLQLAWFYYAYWGVRKASLPTLWCLATAVLILQRFATFFCTDKTESATRMREFHGFLWAFLWASSALANCMAGRSSSLKQWANLGVDKSTVNRIRKNVAMEFARMRVALWFLLVQERCKPL